MTVALASEAVPQLTVQQCSLCSSTLCPAPARRRRMLLAGCQLLVLLYWSQHGTALTNPSLSFDPLPHPSSHALRAISHFVSRHAGR